MNATRTRNTAKNKPVRLMVRIGDDEVKVGFRKIGVDAYRVKSAGLPTLHIEMDDEIGKFVAEASERRHVIGDVKAPTADRAFVRAVKQFWLGTEAAATRQGRFTRGDRVSFVGPDGERDEAKITSDLVRDEQSGKFGYHAKVGKRSLFLYDRKSLRPATTH
jgi:hypothetical protein